MKKSQPNFLYQFEYPREIFISIFLETVRKGFLKSKFAESTDELIGILRKHIYRDIDKVPEQLPLISGALRTAGNYVELTDEHPSLTAIKCLLIPELMILIDKCLWGYRIAKDSEINYNYFSGTASYYKLVSYRKNLLKYNRINNLLSDDNDEETVRKNGESFRVRPGRPRN